MQYRNVICRNEDCDLFEEEHGRELDINYEDTMEWGEWECPSCLEVNFYEADRVYDYTGPESNAHARGDK